MKKYLAFYIPYLVFVVAMCVLLLSFGKAELHLWMTSRHTEMSDFFFRYYTEVGAWIPFLVAGGLLFYSYRAGIFILVAQLFTGLIAQLVKFTWNEPRPKLYFQLHFPDKVLHYVSNVSIHTQHSFPSGHTTAAFALFLGLSIMTSKKYLHLLYVVLAVLVGYSRIYLSQHFAIDVLIGSAVGILFTLPCKYWSDHHLGKWADGSLRDVFSRKRV